MKVCTKCKLEKDIESFNWKVKNIKRQTHCKICQSNYTKEHYKNNKGPYLERAKVRNKRIKSELQEFIIEYLLKHPCIDCGETDIVVLEFDHRERNKKKYNVGAMILRMLDLNLIIEEVSKCDVRCANCHRRKSQIESKSFKSLFNQ